MARIKLSEFSPWKGASRECSARELKIVKLPIFKVDVSFFACRAIFWPGINHMNKVFEVVPRFGLEAFVMSTIKVISVALF